MASDRPDPFRPTFSERFREVVTPWKLLAALIGVALLTVIAVKYLSDTPKQVEAVLIRFGSTATDEGDMPSLVVRLESGVVHQVLARRADVRLCKPGQTVRLVRRGWLLKFQPGGCVVRDAGAAGLATRGPGGLSSIFPVAAGHR